MERLMPGSGIRLNFRRRTVPSRTSGIGRRRFGVGGSRFAWALIGLVATGLYVVTHHRARLPGLDVFRPETRIDGRVHISDGDSLVIDGERIRLIGIDAPELDQTCVQANAPYPCGAEAKRHLAGLIGDRPVACASRKRDKYHRLLAVCRAGDVELNAAMVRDGWAIAYGGYTSEEAEAHAARRGLWAGGFDWPQDFRKAKRGDVDPEFAW